jgi:hypothetical protein
VNAYEAIRKSTEDGPRERPNWLVLADFLEEQGNPACEAIRLLVKFDHKTALHLYQFPKEWLPKLSVETAPTKESLLNRFFVDGHLAFDIGESPKWRYARVSWPSEKAWLAMKFPDKHTFP